MEVTAIPKAFSFSNEYAGHVESLMDSVGRSGFEKNLFRLAQEAMGCKYVVTFTGLVGHPSESAILEGFTEMPLRNNQRYLRRYWKHDPINEAEKDFVPEACHVVSLRTRDIPDEDYRVGYFAESNVKSRASICYGLNDNRMLRLNFYFDDDGAFIDRNVQFMADHAEWLRLLLKRHGIVERRSIANVDQSDVSARLRQLAPELSRRELEVCTHIARGLSSEGIALELGISVNTVLTYRKRAYARLNISTQNELLRLFAM